METYNMKIKSYLFVMLVVAFCAAGCKKDKVLETVPDNNVPDYDGVATVIVENYVNRTFIDLIGREPLDIEMEAEVAALETASLSAEARSALISKLQTDITPRQGDSSYQYAYYIRFKELVMARMLEGASDGAIDGFLGPILFGAMIDSINGDWNSYNEKMARAQKLIDLKTIHTDYLGSSVTIREIFRRTIDNEVYDEINMNSFNFINACFDDLYDRFPSSEEFNRSYEMVEFSNASSIFGQSGANKDEYMDIVTSTDEFYEGVIHWQFNSLLARNATSAEIFKLLPQFKNDLDVQFIQLEIMKSDEYANFD
ncbi:MAG: hypothetical protein MRY83_05430 [Flavobacteriales bacterium]|nr:hypothetical protein [Flavobacteriales bacterium]